MFAIDFPTSKSGVGEVGKVGRFPLPHFPTHPIGVGSGGKPKWGGKVKWEKPVAKTVENKKRDPLPQSVRFDVLRRDNFSCRYCGKTSGTGVTLHVDHKVAVANGGTNLPDNLVTACSDCNFGKGTKGAGAVPSEGERKSVVGWFGYTVGADGRHEKQFEIVRDVGGDRYAIQLFSWFDGCPTEVQFMTGSDLFSYKCRLFTSEREWVRAACEESYRWDKQEQKAGRLEGRVETPDERFADWLAYRHA